MKIAKKNKSTNKRCFQCFLKPQERVRSSLFCALAEGLSWAGMGTYFLFYPNNFLSGLLFHVPVVFRMLSFHPDVFLIDQGVITPDFLQVTIAIHATTHPQWELARSIISNQPFFEAFPPPPPPRSKLCMRRWKTNGCGVAIAVLGCVFPINAKQKFNSYNMELFSEERKKE